MRASLKQTQAALLKNERLATIGQMASSIIHDLRNPLATISTAAEVLKNDGLSPERRHEMIETQLQASHRMSAMLGEILDFSHGSYKLNRTRQPLIRIVRRLTGGFGSRLDHLRIELELRIPEEIVIAADCERIERVFENLLVNAIEAMPDGGRIVISATENNHLARVDVVDDGPGVPPQIRERIFEPFISHGKQGGTGLGLAVARGIVEAHGGRIGLADTPERGAHFYLELPDEAAHSEWRS
jgi:signal transduction histidine kinase